MDKIHKQDKPKKEDLIILYDICNKIFNKEECFYTKAEMKKIKENKQNIFL